MYGRLKTALFAVSVAFVVGLLPCAAFADLQAGSFGGEPEKWGNLTLATQGSDAGSATLIPLNSATPGKLADYATEWYKVEIPSDGKFELVFDGDYQSSGSWYLTLFNQDNSKIWYGSYYANNTVPHTICTTGLPKGTYYISVYNNGSFSVTNVPFRITPKFTADSTWETELNDSIVTADQASLGTPAHGNLQNHSTGDDKDWFRVTLPQKGTFTVLLNGDYSDSGTYRVELYRQDNTRIAYSMHSAYNVGSVLACTGSLDAGTYYIQVSGNGNDMLANKSYSLTPFYIADKPTAVAGLKYTGQVQTGVHAREGSTLSGTVSAVDAGSYSATADLEGAYIWQDGTRSAITIPWTIGANENGSGAASNVSSSATSQPMHRLYNPNSGEHFYTANESEYQNVKGAGWNDEGFGWTAPEKSDTPVYRLYNKYGGEHHYTTSKGERDNLVRIGWTDEGIGWYSDDAKSVPLYREYNPNAFANNHNYTTSASEHRWLLSLGWRDEGYAWYGV